MYLSAKFIFNSKPIKHEFICDTSPLHGKKTTRYGVYDLVHTAFRQLL